LRRLPARRRGIACKRRERRVRIEPCQLSAFRVQVLGADQPRVPGTNPRHLARVGSRFAADRRGLQTPPDIVRHSGAQHWLAVDVALDGDLELRQFRSVIEACDRRGLGGLAAL
jgi:hypothetical protein